MKVSHRKRSFCSDNKNDDELLSNADISVDLDDAANDIPDCWSYNQFCYFKAENSWLTVKDKMLKCTVGSKGKSMGCTSTSTSTSTSTGTALLLDGKALSCQTLPVP